MKGLLMVFLRRDFLFNYASFHLQRRFKIEGGLSKSVGWGLKVRQCVKGGSQGDLWRDCGYLFLNKGHGKTFIQQILGQGERRNHIGDAMANQGSVGRGRRGRGT
jgi:hypothetical protein